ncbi:hypothetical protein AB0N05_21830 [Nocardia sp. NPDC051030]|uniref:hypothetical protein n=1 Tax=Nocardia sp. NPDC051030 TaxID=3155162 RepID=UPI003449C669
MGEIPGARAELDRLGGALRAQLVELISELTPGTGLDLLFLDEPTVVDWHEPLKYRYSTDFRGARAAEVGAAEVARLGAGRLAAAGWTVSQAPEADGSGTVVTGTRDGMSIEIRVAEHVPNVLFSGRTPAMALFTPSFEWPAPVRTPENLTPGYVLCYECDGLGRCPECGGRGWLPDEAAGRVKCPECLGRRVCPICRDAGELAISQLQPFQRGYYPELGKRPE